LVLYWWVKQGNTPKITTIYGGHMNVAEFIPELKVKFTNGSDFAWIETPDGNIHFLGFGLIEKYQDRKIKKALGIR
jgi:hypothetical protein